MRLLIACIQIRVSCHSGEPPEVLILAIRAVAPAKSLKSNKVFACFYIRGNVKFGRHLAVFGIPYILSVYPKVDVRRYRTEVSNHLFARKRSRQVDNPAIASYVIIFYRHFRRIVFKVSPPCKTNVYIHRITVSVQFPDAGHGHISPFAVVERLGIKIRWTLVGMLHPIKFPLSMQRKEVIRSLHVAL